MDGQQCGHLDCRWSSAFTLVPLIDSGSHAGQSFYGQEGEVADLFDAFGLVSDYGVFPSLPLQLSLTVRGYM